MSEANPPGDSASAGQEPAPKRRRVALACVLCRTRKSRCNGARPRCSSCEYLDFECVYETAAERTTAPSSTAKGQSRLSLEQRLKAIEDTLATRTAPGVQANDAPTASSTNTELHGPVAATSSTAESASGNINLDVASLQDLPRGDGDVTDGMAISFIDDHESAFFGASSNIAFSRHVIQAGSLWWSFVNGKDPRSTPDKNRPSALRLFETSRAPSPAPALTAELPLQASLTLPPVAELENLIASYFANTGLIFPFIHQPTFLEEYHRFKTCGFSRVRRTWLGLLNVVLALASSTALTIGGPKNRDSAAWVFYNRSIATCAIPVLRYSNLEVVQSLLLLTQYLQGTQMSVQAWSLHGLAVKACLSLGLHCVQAPSQFSPVEHEARKRAWLGCVSQDRLLSMTFGRPPLIPQEYIRVSPPQVFPLPSDHSLPLEARQASDEQEQLSTEFFSRTIDLYEILGRTIGSIYGFNLESTVIKEETELAKCVLALDQSLELWRSSLPSVLSPDLIMNGLSSGTEADPLALRLRTILTLRFLSIQSLIHRSLMLARLDRLNVPQVDRRPIAKHYDVLMSESIDTCTKAARHTIDIVHAALSEDIDGRGLLGAWWFTLYYVFTAALTVYGGLTICGIEKAAEPTGGLRSENGEYYVYLSRAMTTMNLLGRDHITVRKCVRYIEHLLQITTRTADIASLQLPPTNDIVTASTGQDHGPNPLDFMPEIDLLYGPPDLGIFATESSRNMGLYAPFSL